MNEKTGIQIRLLMFALLWGNAAPALAQETGNLGRLRQEALDLTNESRSEEGLAELSPSDVLDEAAQGQITGMIKEGEAGMPTAEIILHWLREDAERPRKQPHRAKRVLDRLLAEHGFIGGYS